MGNIDSRMNRVPKQRATIVTVDPSQRLIEVATSDGGIRRLAVFDIPSYFTWPVQGEEWSIYEENGYWYLGNRFFNEEEDALLTTMQPGQGLMDDYSTYSITVGNGSATSFVITHNLNSQDIFVQARDAASPYELVNLRVEATSLSTATVYFASAPATDSVVISITVGGGKAGPTGPTGPVGPTGPGGDGSGWVKLGDFTNNTTYLQFAGIPQTYQHLRVVWVAQSNRASYANTGGRVTINNSTAAFYTIRYNTTTTAAARLDTRWYIGQIPAANRTSDDLVCMVVMDFPFYSRTDISKTFTAHSAGDDGTNALGATADGVFVQNALPITSIELKDDVGANLGPRSRAELWAC
jgi:hypothetical protein